MPLVTAKGVAKCYGAQDLFWDISLQVGEGDKVALVGPNGEGKSALLRIIAGREEPVAGQIHRKRGLRIGFLPQNADSVQSGTIWQEMQRPFSHLHRMEARLRGLEEQMAREGSPSHDYSALLDRFARAGGYAYEARIRQVLGGVGFHSGDFQRPLSQLSGGERTRALLGRLLLEDQELLLLDEPTNHLDVRAIEWLEDWLSNWPGSLVVVAHDRYFLDRVVNRTWDLSFGRLEAYPGNYSTYVTLKEQRVERDRRQYAAQRDLISRTEDFVRRYRAGQRSKEARGRERRLIRLERLERPREHKSIHLDIQPATTSGRVVLGAQALTVGYPTRLLFTCGDLCLERGECAALLGPNGSGKTTFLRTLLGEMAPLSGKVELGHGVRAGYLQQRQEDLDPDRTVVEEILSVKEMPVATARTFLGSYLFGADDVFKSIAELSGGERSRVALAKLTLQGANFLVLDEPTNHLDIVSREVLSDVLLRFDGTILFVSHDRSLVDTLATQVWFIEDERLAVHRGNYGEYVSATGRMRPAEKPASDVLSVSKAQARARTDPVERDRHQQALALEEHITGLERRLRELEDELSLASESRRVEDLYQLGREHGALQRRLSELVEQWGDAAEG